MSAVSVDAVVLRGDETGTRVLVHRRAADPFLGDWALPGVLLGSGERITAAATRAAGKAHVSPEQVSGAGQLVVFDEPNRDPRGPTLSVATWVATRRELALPKADDARWVDWDALPELAFDHERILADVRPLLASKLWSDRDFTKALTGPEFEVRTALAITESLAGRAVDRGNLNRDIERVAERAGEAPRRGRGRPGVLWRWPSR
ncbi:NUDIX domain-containing protein [Tsukamurella tyrosinosolvens]|nr:NUDIX domain-containing protein [Tsukamurella tyrosinosolvens]